MSKILNMGSINIDYVYSVPHFVKAGETLATGSSQVFLGGKELNQSIAIARASSDNPCWRLWVMTVLSLWMS